MDQHGLINMGTHWVLPTWFLYSPIVPSATHKHIHNLSFFYDQERGILIEIQNFLIFILTMSRMIEFDSYILDVYYAYVYVPLT